MAVYFDTALILKLFVREHDSAQILQFAASLRQPVYLSDFHRAEFHNALQLKVGRGEITAADAAAVTARLRSEMNAGAFLGREPDWKKVFSHTIQLSNSHAASTFCRTLDAIHVAVALTLGIKEFATLDRRQRTLAAAAGLKVLIP